MGFLATLSDLIRGKKWSKNGNNGVMVKNVLVDNVKLLGHCERSYER